MLTVLKTAIVTITISFISGVLLDTYKNYAPRILCTMGKAIPIRLNNKRIKAYNLTVKNVSNKTLHNLTLCIQEKEAENNLKVDEAKITGGLKFDISNEEEDYNVNIPFLSKNDEFTVKLFVENHQGYDNRPIITLRSPENFKRIDRGEKRGLSGLLSSITQSIGQTSDNKNNYEGERHNSENRFLKKKALITTGVVILALCSGVFGIEYYNSITNQSQSSNEKTIINETDHSKTSSNMSSNDSNLNQSTNTNKNKSSVVKDLTEEAETESNIKDSSSGSDNTVKAENNKATENIQKDQGKEKSDSSEDDKNKETNKSNTDEKPDSVVKNESPDKGASTEKINQQLDSDTKPSSQNTKVNEEKKTAVDSQSVSADKDMIQKNNSPDRESGNK